MEMAWNSSGQFIYSNYHSFIVNSGEYSSQLLIEDVLCERASKPYGSLVSPFYKQDLILNRKSMPCLFSWACS